MMQGGEVVSRQTHNLEIAKNGSILPVQRPGIIAPNGRPVMSPPHPELPEGWLLRALATSIPDAQFRGSYMKDGLHFGVQCGIKRDGGYLVKSYGLQLFHEDRQVFYRHPIRWFLQRRGKFFQGERIDYSHAPTRVKVTTAMAQMFMEWIDGVESK